MNNAIIIGSGPAGISASLYLARAGIDTIVIAKDIGALKKAEKIENYYGFTEPISGKQLHENGINQAKRLGVKFVDEEVFNIEYGEEFKVITNKSTLSAKGIIIATGSARNTPKIKNIKELDGNGVSYCAICDAFFYRNKNVAVLGNSEYALHEANVLLPLVNSLTLLTDGNDFSLELPEKIKLNTEKIKSLLGTDRISGVEFVNDTKLYIDGLFIALGTADSTALARKLGILTENNKIVIDENFATNIPNIYAVGDCTGGLLQVSKAVWEGAKAGTELSKNLRKLQ
ncbi:MAG: NAD(P)/FAD-dependent oxidoreductase [Clostridia bacterium]